MEGKKTAECNTCINYGLPINSVSLLFFLADIGLQARPKKK